MAATGPILLGTIIYADVKDPVTRAPAGPHPCVVLNSTAEIAAGSDLRVAVCTTSYSLPLQSGWFEMPAKPGGHEVTGLDQACVVKATWIEIVPKTDVIKLFKRAPGQLFKQILNWLKEEKRKILRAAAEPPT